MVTQPRQCAADCKGECSYRGGGGGNCNTTSFGNIGGKENGLAALLPRAEAAGEFNTLQLQEDIPNQRLRWQAHYHTASEDGAGIVLAGRSADEGLTYEWSGGTDSTKKAGAGWLQGGDQAVQATLCFYDPGGGESL
jgi:hypothetical protein